MQKHTIKNGHVFGYDQDQIFLYNHRINNDGHEHYAIPPKIITVDDINLAVTKKRWEVETGGLTLPTGVKVATALGDQNRITTVVADARLAGLDSVKFKAASGWVTLSVAEVEAIAAAIAMHVQACFAAECAHHEAIDALANAHAHDDEVLQTALNAYDTSQGWPAADLREPASA